MNDVNEKLNEACLNFIQNLMDFENVNEKRKENNETENKLKENKKIDSSDNCCDSCCNKCKEEDKHEDFSVWEEGKVICDTLQCNSCSCSSEKVNLPKRVYFFTSSGIEKTLDESIDVAMNKAKMFDSLPISPSSFIQVDKDCEIKNSFTGATLEDSIIYSDASWMSFVNGSEIEVFDTIGILELKDRKSENKFIFVKTLRNVKTEENSSKEFDEITRIEDYLMNIYSKSFSNDFDLINTHIASESIELDKYPKTKPAIIAGIQLINY